MEIKPSQHENSVPSDELDITKENEAGTDDINIRKRKSTWIRIGFLVLFVIISTLPVVKGCGAYTVSTTDVMTMSLSEKMSDTKEVTPFITVAVVTLWSTVILLIVSLFPMKERNSSRITFGAAVTLSGYLLTVVAYANKDVQTSNIISLESGWYLLLVFAGVLYAHKYLLRRFLGGGPMENIRAVQLSMKSNPETKDVTKQSKIVAVNGTDQELAPEGNMAVKTDDDEAAELARDDAESVDEKSRAVLKPKRKKWKIVVGIVVGIVVLVVAVFGGLMYLEYMRIQDAIELTKSYEYEGVSWGDLARHEIESNPTREYRWVAENRGEGGVYFVQFIDADGWGKQWETDIEEKTVKLITGDEYLSRKYGITSVHTGEYNVSIEDTDELSIVLDGRSDGGAIVKYALEGSIQNKSGKHVSDVEIEYRVLVVYENETIKDALRNKYILDRSVSRRSPWMPDERTTFSFRTQGIDAAYFRTEPAYFVCQIWVHAEDMSGYEYKHCVAEIDLMEHWGQVVEKIKDRIKENERLMQLVVGSYVRNPEQGDATLQITESRNGTLSVVGEAYYDDGSEYGPNIGTLNFEAPLEGNSINYTHYSEYGDKYEIVIRFVNGTLQVSDSGTNDDFGLNVDFGGSYKKQ